MGLLDSIRKALGGSGRASPNKGRGNGGGSSTFGDDKRSYWIYASCNRCGEPLKGRVDLLNEPSQDDDGTWVVRKGLLGSGKNLCFQTVEVTLRFNAKKDQVSESEAAGGKLLTAEEYAILIEERARAAQQAAEQEQGEAGVPPVEK